MPTYTRPASLTCQPTGSVSDRPSPLGEKTSDGEASASDTDASAGGAVSTRMSPDRTAPVLVHPSRVSSVQRYVPSATGMPSLRPSHVAATSLPSPLPDHTTVPPVENRTR